jgi:hypothetical protein
MKPFAVIAVVIGCLALASAAQASLFLSFSRTTARLGQRVVARSPNRWYEKNGSLMPAGKFPGVTVYLVPMRLADGAGPPQPGSKPPNARNVVRLGPMLIDRHGYGYLSFTVPAVRAGLYTTGFWCKTCLPGGDFFTSAHSFAGWIAKSGPVLRIRH